MQLCDYSLIRCKRVQPLLKDGLIKKCYPFKQHQSIINRYVNKISWFQAHRRFNLNKWRWWWTIRDLAKIWWAKSTSSWKSVLLEPCQTTNLKSLVLKNFRCRYNRILQDQRGKVLTNSIWVNNRDYRLKHKPIRVFGHLLKRISKIAVIARWYRHLSVCHRKFRTASLKKQGNNIAILFKLRQYTDPQPVKETRVTL